MAALDHLLLLPDTGLPAFGGPGWAGRIALTPPAWLRQGAVANTPAAILTNIAKLTYLGVEE